MANDKVSDYREIIETEHRRVDERLTILSQFHGLLFTALALGWDKSFNLIILISVLGILSSIVIARSLFQALRGIDLYYKEYRELPKQLRDSSGPVIGYYPVNPKDKIPRIVRMFLTPSLVLPILLMFGWFAIIIIKLFSMC